MSKTSDDLGLQDDAMIWMIWMILPIQSLTMKKNSRHLAYTGPLFFCKTVCWPSFYQYREYIKNCSMTIICCTAYQLKKNLHEFPMIGDGRCEVLIKYKIVCSN